MERSPLRKRRARRALGLALLALALSAGPALAAAPPERHPVVHAGRVGFDLLILRPFQFVQVVVSAAIFLPAYPVSFLFDGDEDVMEALITEPTDRLFRTPLGNL